MHLPGTVRLETEKLILRQFTEADAESVYRNWASDPEVTRYLTWPTHTCVEMSRWYMDFCVASYEVPSTFQWGIELKETGELIGNISVVHLDPESETAELGWVLGRSYWGRGIMPEAARKVIDFLFDEVGVSVIRAEHDVLNPKSGRVMQKLGMTREIPDPPDKPNNNGMAKLAGYRISRKEFERRR